MMSQSLQHLALLGKNPDTTRLRFLWGEHPAKKSLKADFTLSEIERANQSGRNAYLVVNDGGDLDSEISSCLALFAEWDDRPLDWQITAWKEFGMPEPTFQVATGGKSIHSYWVFDEPCEDSTAWKELQKALLTYLGADPSICNPSRVMRLAGGIHAGSGKRSEIIAAGGSRYSFDDLAARIPSEFWETIEPIIEREIKPVPRPIIDENSGGYDPYKFLSREHKALIDFGIPSGSRNDDGRALAMALAGISRAAESEGVSLAYDPKQLFIGALAGRDIEDRENQILWNTALAKAESSRALLAQIEKDRDKASRPSSPPPPVKREPPAAKSQSSIPDTPAWSAWLNGRKFTPDQIVDQQYLDIEPPREGEILAVKSGTGTGKTQWETCKVVPHFPDRGFEFEGYRNGLLLQTAAKIEAANPDRTAYHLQRDLKGDDRGALAMVRDPKSILLLCADSLVYHEPSDFDGKIIIIDEPIAVIKHLLEASSMRHRDKVKFLFAESLRRAYAVVLTDGHLNDRLCDYLADLSGKPVRKIENIYRGNKGKIRLLKGTYASENALKFARANGLEPELNQRDYSPIQTAILDNPGRIAVGSDSQERLELLDRLLQERGKKGIRFDSTTSSSEWAAELMADPTAYIEREQPDYFLYSPSGEAGLDISIRGYFEDLYFLFFGVVGTDEQLQFLARVRDPAARKSVWITPASMGKKSVLSESLANDIKPALLAYALDCSRQSFASDEDRAMAIARHIVEASSDRHFDHECRLLANATHENAHPRECFTAAALASGYEIEDMIAAAIDDEAIDKAKGDMRSEIAAAMHDRENLSDSEASRLEGDFAATEGDKLALKKYKLLAPFPGIVDREIEHEIKDPETGETKIESRPLLNPELIERLLYEDRDLARKFERRYWLENIEAARKHQRQKWIKACERALDPDKPRSLNLSKWRSDLLEAIALHDLGLHNFLAPGFEWDAKSIEVIELYSLIRKSKRIQRDLNFQPGSQKPIEIVSRLLKRIGVRTKSSQPRKGEGKKQIRVYSLAPINPIDEQLRAAVGDRLSGRLEDLRTTKTMLDLAPSPAALILNKHDQNGSELSQNEVTHLTPEMYIKVGQGVSATTPAPYGLEVISEGHTRDDSFSPKSTPIEPQNEPPLLPISEPIAPQMMSAHERVQVMLERDRLAYLAQFEVSPSMI